MDWGWGQGIKSTTHRRVKEFGYSCRQRRLTWAKEKKNWTVAQWSKVLFSDESKFCISFGNQGPRVWRKGGEAHSPSCLKSSVKFPQSVMIWGAMSSVGVGPLCFLKTNVTAPVSQENLEHFMLPSADQLLKMLIWFSSRTWHLPTLPKALQKSTWNSRTSGDFCHRLFNILCFGTHLLWSHVLFRMDSMNSETQGVTCFVPEWISRSNESIKWMIQC